MAPQDDDSQVARGTQCPLLLLLYLIQPVERRKRPSEDGEGLTPGTHLDHA